MNGESVTFSGLQGPPPPPEEDFLDLFPGGRDAAIKALMEPQYEYPGIANALIGSLFNLVGKGLSFIPGLSSLQNIGSQVFGQSKENPMLAAVLHELADKQELKMTLTAERQKQDREIKEVFELRRELERHQMRMARTAAFEQFVLEMVRQGHDLRKARELARLNQQLQDSQNQFELKKQERDFKNKAAFQKSEHLNQQTIESGRLQASAEAQDKEISSREKIAGMEIAAKKEAQEQDFQNQSALQRAEHQNRQILASGEIQSNEKIAGVRAAAQAEGSRDVGDDAIAAQASAMLTTELSNSTQDDGLRRIYAQYFAPSAERPEINQEEIRKILYQSQADHLQNATRPRMAKISEGLNDAKAALLKKANTFGDKAVYSTNINDYKLAGVLRAGVKEIDHLNAMIGPVYEQVQQEVSEKHRLLNEALDLKNKLMLKLVQMRSEQPGQRLPLIPEAKYNEYKALLDKFDLDTSVIGDPNKSPEDVEKKINSWRMQVEKHPFFSRIL